MNIDHDRDLTAKEDGPKLPPFSEEIAALADEMVSSGYIMSDMNVTYWVSILRVTMINEKQTASGIVFAGLYSSHDRAMAAARGIVADIYRDNREVFPDIDIDNTIIETFVDVVPKPHMHGDPTVSVERITDDPEA